MFVMARSAATDGGMSLGECTARLRCSDLSEGILPFRGRRAVRDSVVFC